MTKAADSGGAGESKRKLTRGRQKIEMKRIASEEARQVCFSKRRAGLFKKANELAVLCGAHLTVVVFSPAGRPFSFGHPSVHAVLDRFLAASTPPPSTPAAVVPHQTVVQEFDREMGDLSKALDAARRRKEMLEEVARKAGVWSNADVQGKGLAELEAMRAALERVQVEAAERASAVISEEAMQCEQREAHGVFAAGGGSHEVLDMGMVVMAGNVGHGAPHGHGHGHALAPLLPFAPLQPPLNPALNHGFGYNLKVGRGYTLNSGNGLGSTLGVYAKVEGFYGQGTFFG